MVLTFLGTSHGVPEKNRKCSSILLEVGENKYLIDMGCDVSSILTDKGISLDKINAVFITHQHGDHTNGLFAYTELCNWYYTSGEQNIFIPRHELREFITSWLGLNGQKEMRPDIHFYEYSEGLIYEDEKIKVTAYLTGHIKYSYAFSIFKLILVGSGTASVNCPFAVISAATFQSFTLFLSRKSAAKSTVNLASLRVMSALPSSLTLKLSISISPLCNLYCNYAPAEERKSRKYDDYY